MVLTARAVARNQWHSPRKVRRVADLVRGKSVGDALNILHFSPTAASTPVEKTVRSAMANLLEREQAQRLAEEEVVISNITVDGGSMLKKWRPRAMGRAYRVRRRTCHITVEVSAETEG